MDLRHYPIGSPPGQAQDGVGAGGVSAVAVVGFRSMSLPSRHGPLVGQVPADDPAVGIGAEHTSIVVRKLDSMHGAGMGAEYVVWSGSRQWLLGCHYYSVVGGGRVCTKRRPDWESRDDVRSGA